ncbi:MAG: L-threonylcarbamoyladenylate synthase [Defluviitaleaceae bacterium]|nr:L-threonylcarbamoyladenylate synthase [Defluviitaleaceae bacterium]
MKTKIIKINSVSPEKEKIYNCVETLKSGGTVVFPTETVYGIGAYAFNPNSIKKIFLAKGRPSDNPLIVHCNFDNINYVCSNITDKEKLYMDKFWPGPLTIILPKNENLPNIALANLPTVAVRIPNNKIALEIVNLAGPIAAPSANLSGKPSPTSTQHVIDDLFGKVDIIIDSESSTIGLESTVIDVNKKIILRPGHITKEDLSIFGDNFYFDFSSKENKAPSSPGQKYKHYAPNAKTIIITGFKDNVIQKIKEFIYTHIRENIGILCTDETINEYENIFKISLGSITKPKDLCRNLYNALRVFDKMGIKEIYIENFYPKTGIFLSLLDRLVKASSYNILNV